MKPSKILPLKIILTSQKYIYYYRLLAVMKVETDIIAR
jgi:hypothetical protein